ncbi:MAG: MFS transporter [Chloroflexi bacterium]|nr:MFS transporter [Chloroflexota bacterium]MDA1241045.1 MFS transporter [Chloroflexota bacterium]
MSHSPWFHRRPTLLPGRPIDAARLYLGFVGLGGGFMSMMTVMYSLYVVRDVGLTPFQLVIAGTALEASVLLFEVPTGVLADAVSRRLSVIVGYAVMAFGMVLMGAVPEFWAVVAGQFTWGFGFTFISGAREAWLADEVGEEAAGALYPRGARWRLTAMVAGALVGGAIGLAGPHLAFIASGVGLALLSMALAFVMPERAWRPAPRGERSSWASMRNTAASGFRATRAKPVLVAAFILMALMGMSSESFDRLWAYLLIEEIGIPDSVNDVLLFTGLQIGAQLGGIVAIRVVERRTSAGGRSVTTALLLLNAAIIASMLAFSLAPVLPVAIGLGWATIWARNAEEPFFLAWVNRGLDPATRATVLSTIGQANAIGQIAGGPAFGLLAQLATVRVAIAAAALVLLPALPIYARERRRADREADV